MSAQQIHYRPDIDGLRAVAILAVVLYHLKVPGFSGGFVGVDIFFAISGFLIFSILNREYETNNRVDWVAFFARRIRRLLPEATIMIATVMVLGFFVLLPFGEQQSLAKSGIAGSLWLSNIYFWRFEGDYFSPSVERQPLLHLWSLGVEEQFYLTVPLMFIFAGILSHKLGPTWRRSVTLLLSVAGLLSLGIAVWATNNTASVAAYYLLPSRAYEFAIGALAALWLEHSRRAGVNRANICAATLMGLAGLVLSVAVASREEKVPGVWGLLPAVSTALILWSGGLPGSKLMRNFLEPWPTVYLGKISYGWYLWHFPLLVLWREYWLLDTPVWAEAAVVSLAIVPAAVGYHVVLGLRGGLNSRIVRPAAASTQQIFGYGGLACVAAVLVSVGLGAHAKFIGSEAPEMAPIYSELNDTYIPEPGCFPVDSKIPNLLPECVFGDPDGDVTLVIWGDSHANHWVPALNPTFRKLGIRGVERVSASCLPALHESKLLDQDRFGACKEFGEKVLLDLVKRRSSGPVGVILAARWAAYVNDRTLSIIDRGQFPTQTAPGGPATEESLRAVVTELASLRIPIGILLQVPEQKAVVPICVRSWPIERCEVLWSEEQVYQQTPKSIISRIAESSNAIVLDPTSFLCREDKCRITEGEILLYRDDDHLSKRGASSLAPFLSDFVSSLRASALATP